MKAIVYFSREIAPEKIVEMYQKLGKKLEGKVAVKLHLEKKKNRNFWIRNSGSREYDLVEV